MMSIAITLHMLAAVVWVGGMFFAFMALRPAAASLDPAIRLPLWRRTFALFFPWVWAAVILLPLTGYWIVFANFGGFRNVGAYIHIMHATGLVMILVFLHVFFAPYQRLARYVDTNDFEAAGKQLALIRKLIGFNLIVGLITVLTATSGAYWLS